VRLQDRWRYRCGDRELAGGAEQPGDRQPRSHRMSYFHRPDAGFEPPVPTEESPRSPFSEVAGRFANWITGADRMPGEGTENAYERDDGPIQQLTRPADSDEPSRFPVAQRGYSRAAVDEHLLGLERQLAELRAQRPPAISITEELERIGEQTASILVVAHDQAHETTRQAQEQAERCVADAAANAVAITSQAKQRLRELDAETDSVWRERERLLEDVRVVSAALAALADQASERFPAAEPGSAPQGTVAFRMAPEAGATEAFHMAPEPSATEALPAPPEPPASDASAPAYGPWAGEAFRMAPISPPEPEHSPSAEPADDDSPAPGTQSGDTGSWLAGLEPPDQL
jgi:cell division septum initiation protein DivIVA